MNKGRILSGIVEGERILPDDYPIHSGYLYVADGKVIESSFSGNVGRLKLEDGYKEIRNCDITARNLW